MAPSRSTISTWRVARVRAARAAIDKAGGDVVFTARTEGFIRGRPDLDETIRRLKAYADAGADCLYAPGIKTREQIEAVVKAVAPKPVNFLMSSAPPPSPWPISPASACAASASAARWRASPGPRSSASARRSPSEGRFDGFNGVMTNPELNAFFADDLAKRT